MDVLKALIVDDEPIILKRLINLLQENEGVHVIGAAQSAKDFLELFEKQNPDFLIIDIDLPDMNGMELVKKIRDNDSNIPIIFLTGHSEFAAESYLVNATDYILKPFNKERVFAAIDKLKKNIIMDDTPWDRVEHLLKSPGKIVIKHEGNLLFLNMDQIFLIQKEGKLTTLLTFENTDNIMYVSKYTTRTSMKELHQQLDKNMFIRTHNSYIVNIKWIHEVVRFTTETYKIKFKHTKEYALLNRNKLNEVVKQMV